MDETKWQPMMLVAPHRIECECGALAIFIVLEEREDSTPTARNYNHAAYCQACFAKEQEEEEV